MTDNVTSTDLPQSPTPPLVSLGRSLLRIGGLGVVVVGLAFGITIGTIAYKDHARRSRLAQASSVVPGPVTIDDWTFLRSGTPAEQDDVIDKLTIQWENAFLVPTLESIELQRDPAVREKLLEVAAANSGVDQSQGPASVDDLYRVAWSRPYEPIEDYAVFKKTLYSQLDLRFLDYFDPSLSATIRLDEIRWGGVGQDGIPPLNNPETTAAANPAAAYLAPTDVVFGVVLNGQARCYPKRILAWHEMVKDTVGDVSICGVYCTLCGSMIVYQTDIGDVHYELGTSGFLYRSNKLMYDHGTRSLWSTLRGRPVVGPLVQRELDGQPIVLPRESVVTTTWAKWREQHPETTVLTLNTGHERDYGEGVAYQKYFSHDDLMFAVPKRDTRLKNKTEVVALRSDYVSSDEEATHTLAISTEFLATHPVYHDSVGDQSVVVFTDAAGASRVYAVEGETFREWDGRSQATDDQGRQWSVTEDGLQLGDVTRPRAPSHRAFWFGWSAAFPETRLVQ